jgi:tRNA/tmRNA/rRNA uracil-C5-methylase (TrmA/RlmC/RlmD family)
VSKPTPNHHAGIETGVVGDLTHDAEGVVRPGDSGGKIAFVAGALPGERISFRRRSFTRATTRLNSSNFEASPTRA